MLRPEKPEESPKKKHLGTFRLDSLKGADLLDLSYVMLEMDQYRPRLTDVAWVITEAECYRVQEKELQRLGSASRQVRFVSEGSPGDPELQRVLTRDLSD